MNLKSESRSESESDQPKRTAMASTKADLRELRGNSQATVQEIQDFLRELKGKSPQEMLGLVTASGLFRAILMSTAVVAGAILLFTVIPFFMADEKPLTKPENTVKSVEETNPEPDTPTPQPETAAESGPADTLGIGDELPAPSDVNPLENKSDDFLKDLE